MPKNHQVIGGAGTGKTTALIRILDKRIAEGVISQPSDVAFCSFTKAACWEAANRAASRFEISPEKLRKDGWFKTVHSIAFYLVGAKKDRILSDDSASKKWFLKSLGAALDESETDSDQPGTQKTEAGKAIALWSLARNRLASLTETHARWSQREWLPELTDCIDFVTQYERAKSNDGKLDFVDLLALYAGRWFDPRDGTQISEPMGEVPQVPIFFLDEWQDATKLLDAVAKRLTSKADEVFLAADPFQSIHNWCGSEHHLIDSWQISEKESRWVLPKTYRCPACILELGESLLAQTSDYWDRKIQPADHDGEIIRCQWRAMFPPELYPRPTESWLWLARTNRKALEIGKRIGSFGIPWSGIKIHSPWSETHESRAVLACSKLRTGASITVREWKSVLHHFHVADFFVRGTKSTWEAKPPVFSDATATLATLADWGATEAFITGVRDYKYAYWFADSFRWESAFAEYGVETTYHSKILVGTFHSAKGMEADNVLLLTGLNGKVAENMRTHREILDEELRLAYVGVTRARRRLILMADSEAAGSVI